VHNRRIYPIPRTCGLRHVVLTCPGTEPCMRFLSVGSHVCLRIPSDGRSPFRPCLGLVLVLLWFSYRGLTPHKFTPVPGVHQAVQRDVPLRGTAPDRRISFQTGVSDLMNKPRVWWVAGLLSLVKAGLGQIYNGQLNKGIFIILIGYCYVPLFYFVVSHGLSILALFSMAAVAAIYYIYVVTDSIVVSKRLGAGYTRKKYNTIYVYIGILIFFGVVNHFLSDYIRNNIIEAFKIPAVSMEPTVLLGDHLLVDRSPKARFPKRGDIIVFEYPKDPEKNYLKRVVAVAGDRVEMRDATLYVNDNAVSEPYLKQPDIDNSAKLSSWSNYSEVVVPDNAYFALGDNRDKSHDSRYFGFIEQAKIKGIAQSIYWSWDETNNSVRWDRIGMAIR